MISKKRISVLIFLLHLAALTVYHIFGYTGHFGYDDLHYARLAVNINNGVFDFGDHYIYRFPAVFLTALSYSVFGVSDFASAIPPMIFTGLTMLLVLVTLKNKSCFTQWVGQSLTLFSSWFIFYSDKIMPDIYVAFSVMLALFILHNYKFGNKKRPAPAAFLLSLALLFGFTAKETIVLVAPLFIYFILTDFILKRDIRFWIYTLVTGFFVLSAYFFLIWLLTGNFTQRFEAITNNSYLNLCSYDKQPFKMVLERIGYEFIRLLTVNGMMVGFLFVFVYLMRNRFRSYYRFGDSFSFWLVSAVVLFLSSNFMTISVNSYSPMCLDPRHYLFLVPVVAIPAAGIISGVFESKRCTMPVIFTFVIITVVSYFLPGDTFWRHYLPLTLLFIPGFILKKRKNNPVVFALIFGLILALIPFKTIQYAQKVNYHRQKKIMTEEVLKKYNDVCVVTDEVQKRLGYYYLNFDKNYKATFLNYDELRPDTLPGVKKLLLLNGHTRYLSGINLEDLPYYVRNIHPSNSLIFEDQELGIFIYELDQISIPSVQGTELLHTFNEFEGDVPFWNQNGNEYVEEIRFGGEKSLKIGEFSATFSVVTDSLPIDNFARIIIDCNLRFYVTGNTKSNVVISIENNEEAYIWKGLPIDKYVKAYSNWWPASFEITIEKKEIKSGSKLSVYVWNIEKETMYIDNFDIKIIGMND
jgi:hypothetical protein